jgi:hypothetical protein
MGGLAKTYERAVAHIQRTSWLVHFGLFKDRYAAI